MIGYLTGIVYTKQPDQIILLTHGVGYLVTIPQNRLESLKLSDPIEVYVYPHIREDSFDLYGFSTQPELELFKLILTVSGIGPKTALLVIDRGVNLVETAIKEADADFFTMIPRLGRKNAQKIIIELKSKLGGLKELELSQEGEESMQAIEGLRSMGYTRLEAIKAIGQVPPTEKTLEQKISFALKQLGQAKLNEISKSK